MSQPPSHTASSSLQQSFTLTDTTNTTQHSSLTETNSAASFIQNSPHTTHPSIPTAGHDSQSFTLTNNIDQGSHMRTESFIQTQGDTAHPPSSRVQESPSQISFLVAEGVTTDHHLNSASSSPTRTSTIQNTQTTAISNGYASPMKTLAHTSPRPSPRGSPRRQATAAALIPPPIICQTTQTVPSPSKTNNLSPNKLPIQLLPAAMDILPNTLTNTASISNKPLLPKALSPIRQSPRIPPPLSTSSRSSSPSRAQSPSKLNPETAVENVVHVLSEHNVEHPTQSTNSEHNAVPGETLLPSSCSTKIHSLASKSTLPSQWFPNITFEAGIIALEGRIAGLSSHQLKSEESLLQSAVDLIDRQLAERTEIPPSSSNEKLHSGITGISKFPFLLSLPVIPNSKGINTSQMISYTSQLVTDLCNLQALLLEKYSSSTSSALRTINEELSTVLESLQKSSLLTDSDLWNNRELYTTTKSGRDSLASILQALSSPVDLSAGNLVRAPLYCHCNSRFSGHKAMIQCDSCSEWYHLDCEFVSIPESKFTEVYSYKCSLCSSSENPEVIYQAVLKSTSVKQSEKRPVTSSKVPRTSSNGSPKILLVDHKENQKGIPSEATSSKSTSQALPKTRGKRGRPRKYPRSEDIDSFQSDSYQNENIEPPVEGNEPETLDQPEMRSSNELNGTKANGGTQAFQKKGAKRKRPTVEYVEVNEEEGEPQEILGDKSTRRRKPASRFQDEQYFELAFKPKRRYSQSSKHASEQASEHDSENIAQENMNEEPIATFDGDMSSLLFEEGSQLLFYDTKTGDYYEVIIREVDGDEVLIHYKGWAKKFDEWASIYSGRFAPIGYTEPAKRLTKAEYMKQTSSVVDDSDEEDSDELDLSSESPVRKRGRHRGRPRGRGRGRGRSSTSAYSARSSERGRPRGRPPGRGRGRTRGRGRGRGRGASRVDDESDDGTETELEQSDIEDNQEDKKIESNHNVDQFEGDMNVDDQSGDHVVDEDQGSERD